ncbi:leucine-rich repeat transmembrane protein FLRT2-like [Phyllostomus discolor]|uniref:Leucine-rich repeat transmembrane protein FLRT2-like n=1 Tax=Phyllostomus discolor TaxID=89673 RepID=A0A6J2L7N3_9CHIR|nr:leucine-rich repeat transmembrane protein FLRT2-like [Phyllostomus discolor]XP_035868763.1 leucine-rich repeat transmembrane protein FLRT2-like [Phyllostomus discolor]
MGVQTTQWPSHGAFFLKSWLLISLGLSSQVSKLLGCPSVCRCDRNFVYCNDRNLTSVPLGIPEGVTTLYLQNNQINNTGFPAELHNVQSVHTVYLYSNQLQEFPTNLPKNVRVLHLQENNIETISRAAVAQLLKLEELYLDDNFLRTEQVEIGAFWDAVNLKLLFLSKNILNRVSFGFPMNLQELRVDDNRITTILDVELEDLPSLERLNLDGNLLTNRGIAEGTFRHLTKLKELSLAGNLLSYPPSGLPCRNLLRLYLQDNQINHIPLTAFSKLRKLERLDISNNQLHVLTQGVFDSLSNLKQLTAWKNPWFCDCSIKWVTEWLKYIPSSLSVRGFTCQEPEQVRGMAVTEINMNLCGAFSGAPRTASDRAVG